MRNPEERSMGPIAEMVMELLRSNDPHRELYRGKDGGWHITYQGGQVSDAVAREIIESGEVHSVYSNAPRDAYHIGRTLDVRATREARKKPGQRHAKIYL
jgi:hypothetical protein